MTDDTIRAAQRQRATEVQALAGRDLAAALAEAGVVVGPEVAATIAGWPWCSHSPTAARPDGWDSVTTDEWVRMCMGAILLRFSRSAPALLYLDEGAPLWRVDLDRYGELLNDVLAYADDSDHRFAFVAEDGASGILAEPTDDGFAISCWGLANLV